jgi:hypothetical protein
VSRDGLIGPPLSLDGKGGPSRFGILRMSALVTSGNTAVALCNFFAATMTYSETANSGSTQRS